MNLVLWIVFGILTGIVVNLLDPRPARGGIVGVALLGISGAFLGGLAASLLLGIDIIGFNLASITIGILGSFLLIMLGRVVSI